MSNQPRGYFKRKNSKGKMTTRPIFGSNPNPYRQPEMKMVAVKHNPYGFFARRDIKREIDLIPNCDERQDLGWLPRLEQNLYDEKDAEEQAKIMETIRIIKTGSDAESAIAMTKLETQYPDIYHHLLGRKSDLPKHITEERMSRKAPLKKNLEYPVTRRIRKGESAGEVIRQTATDLKGKFDYTKEKISNSPISDYFRPKLKEAHETSQAEKAQKKELERKADEETKRLKKEATDARNKEQSKKEDQMFEEAVNK